MVKEEVVQKSKGRGEMKGRGGQQRGRGGRGMLTHTWLATQCIVGNYYIGCTTFLLTRTQTLHIKSRILVKYGKFEF